MTENKQILVAEDDELLAELIGHILTQAGFEVVYAEDGEQALKVVRQLVSSLIV